MTIAQFLFSGCSSYKPLSNEKTNNTQTPTEIVIAHLRAIENGDWDKANSILAENYKMKMKGMPFFISIKKKDALGMHKAKKMLFLILNLMKK